MMLPFKLFILGLSSFGIAWTVAPVFFESYRPMKIYPEEILPRGEAL